MRNEHRSKLQPFFSELSLFIAVLMSCLAFMSANSSARAGQGAEVVWTRFDIPAQPLASALTAYGTTTRIALFVGTNLVVGRRSVTLKGLFTAEAGLQSLLAGTGLVAVPMGNGFAIMKAEC
jgi:hypothetical protein